MIPLSNIPVNVALSNCASFFEQDSGLTFIEKDLSFDRDSGKKFSFEFSATDCSNFKLNLNDFKMFLSYQEHRKLSFGSYNRDGNKVSVDH